MRPPPPRAHAGRDKKLAIALTACTDWLLFEEDGRGPDDELKLQFEAIRQFDEEERKTALEVLDGLILKHHAKRMVQRSQSQIATKNTAKAAQDNNHCQSAIFVVLQLILIKQQFLLTALSRYNK